MKKPGLKIVLLLLFSVAAYGQEIGVTGIKFWTDNYELENPPGFGAYGSYPLGKKINARLEYNYATNKREFFGDILSGFMQPDPKPVPPENVESTSTMQALELSLLFRVASIQYFHFDLGPLLGMSFFSGHRKGLESGEEVDLFKEDKWGFGLALLVGSPDFAGVPLGVNLMYKLKVLRSSSAPTDVESPFSDSINISQLQLGVSYKF